MRCLLRDDPNPPQTGSPLRIEVLLTVSRRPWHSPARASPRIKKILPRIAMGKGTTDGRPDISPSGRPQAEGVMRSSDVEFDAAADDPPARATSDHDPVRRLVEVLPQPLRFLGVGGLGLITDLAVFTLMVAHGPHPLLARVVSLAVATLVTWRLNRALTFDRSGRPPGR